MKKGNIIGVLICCGLIGIFSVTYINKKDSNIQKIQENSLTVVEVEKLNKENYEEYIKYPGKTLYGKEENLISMVDEKVTYVGFKEGDYVSKGDVILRFHSSELDGSLSKAKEEYEKALEKAKENDKKLDGIKKQKEDIEKEIEDLENKNKNIKVEIDGLTKEGIKLKEEFEKGLITEEEFLVKKGEIERKIGEKNKEVLKNTGEISTKKIAASGIDKTLEGMGKLNLGNIGVESAKKMYEQLEKMKESYIIKAPISGKITALNGYLNEKVENKMMPLVTISNSETLIFELGIDEEEKNSFTIGEEIPLEIEKEGQVIRETGKVISIDKKPDIRTLQYKVKVEVNNSNGHKVNSYAEAFIDKSKSLNNNMLSKNALIRDGEKNYVYIVKDSIVEKREVVLGEEENHKVIVKDGIKEDELIVIKGKEFITEGEKVKMVQEDNESENK